MRGRKRKYFFSAAGVALGMGLLVSRWIQWLGMWKNDKAQAFETFPEYFFSVSKGTILISGAVTAIFIGLGYVCEKRKMSERKTGDPDKMGSPVLVLLKILPKKECKVSSNITSPISFYEL